MGEVIDFPGKPHEKAKMPERGQLVVVTWVDAYEKPQASSADEVGLVTTRTSGFFNDVKDGALRIITSGCVGPGGTDANGAFAIPVGTILSVDPLDRKVPMP